MAWKPGSSFFSASGLRRGALIAAGLLAVGALVAGLTTLVRNYRRRKAAQAVNDAAVDAAFERMERNRNA